MFRKVYRETAELNAKKTGLSRTEMKGSEPNRKCGKSSAELRFFFFEIHWI